MRKLRAWLCLTFCCVAMGCGFGGSREGIELARSMGLPADVGAICGDGRILGEEIGDVNGSGACGIDDAVRVHAVGGIVLKPTARLNCRTAAALKQWSDAVTEISQDTAGKAITELRVAASYACRRRNNAATGRLSEHAKGNAIDISGITLADGETIRVSGNWRGTESAELMRAFHGAGCGPFGVVLGPAADRYHQTHFHFDVSNMDRKYCR
ncbi:MAG: extensin family protein [Pseudomonadota bacterium]